jgi:hypothetical protein
MTKIKIRGARKTMKIVKSEIKYTGYDNGIAGGTRFIIHGNKRELDLAYCWLLAVYQTALGSVRGMEEFRKVPVAYGILAYHMAVISAKSDGYEYH